MADTQSKTQNFLSKIASRIGAPLPRRRFLQSKAPTAQMRLFEKRRAEAFGITNGPSRKPRNPSRKISSFGAPPAPSFRISSRSGRSSRPRRSARNSCAPADSPSARSTARRASIGAVNAGLVALFVYQRHADGERPGGTPIRSPGGLFVSLIREIEQGHHDLARALATMRQRRRMERRH